MRRRDFTKMAGMGALTMLSFPTFTGTNLFRKEQSSAAKIPLGLCNHSLRSMGLKAHQLVEYAITHKLDSVLLNTFQPFENLNSTYLSQLSKIANMLEQAASAKNPKVSLINMGMPGIY